MSLLGRFWMQGAFLNHEVRTEQETIHYYLTTDSTTTVTAGDVCGAKTIGGLSDVSFRGQSTILDRKSLFIVKVPRTGFLYVEVEQYLPVLFQHKIFPGSFTGFYFYGRFGSVRPLRISINFQRISSRR